MSDLELEQFLVDDLDAAARARVAAAVAADPVLAAHVETRRAEQRAFWSAPSPAASSTALLKRRGRGPFGGARSLPPLAAACAALALFFVVSRSDRDEGQGDDDGAIRARGARALGVSVVVQRGDAQFAHTPGVPLRARDALRIELALPSLAPPAAGGASAPAYATVILVDARGRVTALVEGERVAVAGAPRGREDAVLLDGSFVLDDSVGRERLIAVLSASRAVSSDAVARALRTPEGLAALGGDVRIGEVSIEKEP